MFHAPALARTRPLRLNVTTTALRTAATPPPQPHRPRPPPSTHPLPTRRPLHLAPPFLLDPPYTPRYLTLTPPTITHKLAAATAALHNCTLCPRNCAVDRFTTTGTCLIPAQTVSVSTIAPHFGEEPCIQGHAGSGAVFFSGCSLRCVFCQNHDTAHRRAGFDLTPEELGAWMVKLQDVGGCHNVNLVTAEHVVPQVVAAVVSAREQGLRVPVVYNTSAFDSPESIELLDGVVDIYLPDFKVWRPETARRLLKADGYVEAAKESVRAMQDQVGDLCFTPDGIAKRGVLLRHLVMPGLEGEGVEIMRWCAENVSRDLMVHVMEQYFPRAHVGKAKRGGRRGKGEAEGEGVGEGVRYQDINRAVKDEEVSVVKKAAREAGLWRFIEAAKHGGFNI